MSFKFVDLFCGIGGFHIAMESMGGECVYACDIDEKCRKVYESNFHMTPDSDITKADISTIPNFDVLCAGFPCQPFSRGGKMMGFSDRTRGTLFFEILRFVEEKHPSYILLENVKSILSNDNGRTIEVIYNSLNEKGYNVADPILLSPHEIGIPQKRERCFICARKADLQPFGKFIKPDVFDKYTIYDLIYSDNNKKLNISQDERDLLNHWNFFVKNIKADKMPTFPVWTEFFHDYEELWEIYPLETYPKWKLNYIRKNWMLYDENKDMLDKWLERGKNVKLFKGAKAKLEWQVGDGKRDIYEHLIQFRPSGVRIKTTEYFPTLVAMGQIPIVGKYQRYLMPAECAREQSFPENFHIEDEPSVAYKQFGNSVNVECVKLVAKYLMGL